MNTSANRRYRIAVIAFDGITPFHLSVPGMVFRDAAFELKICSPDPSPLSTTGGFDIAVPHGLQALSRADIVILPTWHDDCRPAPERLLQALQRAPARRASLACASAHSRWRKRECWMAVALPPTGRLPIRWPSGIQLSQLIVKCYM
jgi:transcriptional regulator GlxA family with amidase domain